jgi:uroporphyrinogen-III synthase
VIPLLILRPEPGATDSAKRAIFMRLEPLLCPLFEVCPVAWTAPDPADFDAVLLTSANAARHAGTKIEAFAHLPLFAVGRATARAARFRGFTSREVGTRDVTALLNRIDVLGYRNILHLAGVDHMAAEHRMLSITRRIVYVAVETRTPPIPVSGPYVALLHSPRAARRLAELVPDRSIVRIAALSQAVAAAAGTGWHSMSVPFAPTDEALLAVAVIMCEQEPK